MDWFDETDKYLRKVLQANPDIERHCVRGATYTVHANRPNPEIKFEFDTCPFDCDNDLSLFIKLVRDGVPQGQRFILELLQLDVAYSYRVRCCGAKGASTATPTSADKKVVNNFPHTCPKCKGPAYIGFSSIDCQKGC